MSTMCTHQLARDTRVGVAWWANTKYSSRNVTISVTMKKPIMIDSFETGVPSAGGRAMPRRMIRNTMPASTATQNGTSAVW